VSAAASVLAVRLVACSVLVLARLAVAEPRIVLVQTRGAPSQPTLKSQVELHAGARAAVRTLAAPGSDPMTYSDRASQLIASGEADSGSASRWVATSR